MFPSLELLSGLDMGTWPLEFEAGMAGPCLDYGFVRNICAREVVPDILSLRFRNPDVFFAGGLHPNHELWKKLAALRSYDRVPYSTNFLDRLREVLKDVLTIFISHHVLNSITIISLVLILLIL